MPNGQMEPPKAVKFDAKEELEQSKIRLHNARISIQILEVQIKKLEELSR